LLIAGRESTVFVLFDGTIVWTGLHMLYCITYAKAGLVDTGGFLLIPITFNDVGELINMMGF
jgi:hypothetical protein